MVLNENINILIVDDNREIVSIICKMLQSEGFCTNSAFTGEEAIAIIKQNTMEIHLIIMDLMMPQTNGFIAIETIRKTYNCNCPILILSAKSGEEDKILGLEIGADDYLVKPFLKKELLARVNSALRRYMKLGGIHEKQGKIISYYELQLDTEQRKLFVGEQLVKLTATEYKIVALLMRRIGKIFTAEEIFHEVWDENCYEIENIVSIHMSRIRKKIEVNPRKPEYVKIVWGVGYKIEKK